MILSKELQSELDDLKRKIAFKDDGKLDVSINLLKELFKTLDNSSIFNIIQLIEPSHKVWVAFYRKLKPGFTTPKGYLDENNNLYIYVDYPNIGRHGLMFESGTWIYK